MLTRHFPAKVKFIGAIIYASETNYLKAKYILEKKFGRVDFESNPVNFTFTNYYKEEMGASLVRRFVSFERLQNPERFVEIKLFCMKIEKKFLVCGKRTINIDPGYITEAKLVLTTTKDFCHRIYLGKGVYAEVTLYYRNGDFCDFPTTYPDYRTHRYKQILSQIRETYSHELHYVHKR